MYAAVVLASCVPPTRRTQSLTSGWKGVQGAVPTWRAALERQLVSDATAARNANPPSR